MTTKIKYLLNKVRQQLWFRPAVFCIISIVGIFLARVSDGVPLEEFVPDIKKESIEELLKVISSSMLVIAIFTVGSMLAAFSAASNSATPRSFKLVIGDDVSQNALSAFIGAYIYSIVGLTAMQNGYFGVVGKFVLYVLTILFFVLVIMTFLLWVNRISRLGRINHTIKQVAKATLSATEIYFENATNFATPQQNLPNATQDFYLNQIGYLQSIGFKNIQEICQREDFLFVLHVTPGHFVDGTRRIASLYGKENVTQEMLAELRDAFSINDTRTFEEDVRFGHITLSEIASRALSPAVNDPGTAIQILGTHVRIFTIWNDAQKNEAPKEKRYPNIAYPTLSISDLLTDAFRPIARDGANNIEVQIRLQKSLKAIATIQHSGFKEAAVQESLQAFERAKKAMTFDKDIETLATLQLLPS